MKPITRELKASGHVIEATPRQHPEADLRVFNDDRLVAGPTRVKLTSALSRRRFANELPKAIHDAALGALCEIANEWHDQRADVEFRSESEAEAEAIAHATQSAVVPWDGIVDGSALLAGIESVFTNYLVLTDGLAVAIALWVLFCEVLDAFSLAPILGVTSPAMRCGKTILLELVALLVPSRVPTVNMNAATVFRVIEHLTKEQGRPPTLIYDEADRSLPYREEMIGLINAGYRWGQKVWRCVGDDHTPHAFDVFAPWAVGMIGDLPPTMADRSIPIRMRRKLATEKRERFRQDRPPAGVADLRRQVARWGRDHIERLRDAHDPDIPDRLNDREADNWRALLTIADLIGGDWPKKARAAALALSGKGVADGFEQELLADVRQVWVAAGQPAVIPGTDLAERLVKLPDRPWGDYRNGKPITPAGIARLLGNLDVPRPRPHRVGKASPRGYLGSHLRDAFERYLLPVEAISEEESAGASTKVSQSVTDGTSVQANDLPGTESVTGSNWCDTSKPLQGNDVTPVTLSPPLFSEMDVLEGEM